MSIEPLADNTAANAGGPPATGGRSVSSEPRKLSTALFNLWFDVILAATVSFLTWVSVMMQVVFPPATRARGWTLCGWSYDQWRDAQFVALCACFLLAFEHVVLHWTWVCGVITTKVLRLKKRPDEAVQKMYGIGLFFGLMMIAFAGIVAATFCVKQPSP